MRTHHNPNDSATAPGTSARATLMVLLAGLTACAGGCAGYRLGSTLPPEIQSVFVPTFVNKCGEPLVETEATRAVIQEFQRDGTLSVEERDLADTILEVSIVKYQLEPLRYERDRSKTTREYRLKLTADLVFKARESGKVIVQKRVEGEATFEPGNDLTTRKREALPEAARDLAHDIVEAVVESW